MQKSQRSFLFSSEQQLLLWTIRRDETSDASLQTLLDQPINWATMRKLALKHGLIGLLYQRIKASGYSTIPAEEMQSLKTIYRDNVIRNTQLATTQLQALELLREQGIAAIPVKGPLLAELCYGDVGSRYCVDIDILLQRRQDFYPAYQCLLQAGFQPERPLAAGDISRLQQQVNNYHFSTRHALLELHWEMPEREYAFTVDSRRFWSRLQPASLNGRTVHTLALEDMLLLHAIHGTKHRWSRLVWIADLASLITRNPELCWQDLFATARAAGALRVLFITLLLAERLGGAHLPEACDAYLHADRTADQLADVLATTPFDDELDPDGRTFFHFMWQSRERLTDRLRYLLTPTFNDQNTVRLPSRFFPLYYLIRPFRLSAKFASSNATIVVKSLCRNRKSCQR